MIVLPPWVMISICGRQMHCQINSYPVTEYLWLKLHNASFMIPIHNWSTSTPLLYICNWFTPVSYVGYEFWKNDSSSAASSSSRQSHQHNTDNLANSTTWQQAALQSANSTTSTNTLSEITVDRYSNIQGNIWLNIDRYVILALYARSRITWRRRVLSYPYTMRWIAGCPFSG